MDIDKHRDIAGNILFQNGDVLRIPNANLRQVYVTGEVVSPRPMAMRDVTLTLAETLTSGGGVDPVSSSPDHICATCGSAQKPPIYQLSGKSPSALLRAQQFQLEPRDVVYVVSAGVTRWSGVLDPLLRSADFVQSSASTGAQS